MTRFAWYFGVFGSALILSSMLDSAAAQTSPQSEYQSALSVCPSNLVALRGTTAPLGCICPPNISIATVWGESSSYTDDSDICTAAVHAGMVTAAAGGSVTVTPREGQPFYKGSKANGVTTLPYESWSGSFTITGAESATAR